jgi:pimeloyl-ACP methyl ester carboxylesterase
MGWLDTFLDWGAGLDHLRVLAKTEPLDLTRVVSVGHSAGALAALWVAARDKLPASGEIRGTDPLRVSAAVAIDGPGDLAAMIGPDAKTCDRPVIAPLMDGSLPSIPNATGKRRPSSFSHSGRRNISCRQRSCRLGRQTLLATARLRAATRPKS